MIKISKKIFMALAVTVLITSFTAIGVKAATYTQSRFGIYTKGTMTFDKSNNIVSGARNIKVVKNPGFYSATYVNTVKKPVRYDGNKAYKIQTTGIFVEIGEKRRMIYEDIVGFK